MKMQGAQTQASRATQSRVTSTKPAEWQQAAGGTAKSNLVANEKPAESTTRAKQMPEAMKGNQVKVSA